MILRDSFTINGSLSVLGVSNAVSSNLTALFYNNTNGNVEKRVLGDIINYNASNFLSGFNISVPNIFTTNVSSITPQNNQLTMLLASQSAGTVFAAHPNLNGQPSFMKLTATHLSDAEVMFTNHPANSITSGNINTWNGLANTIGNYLPKSYNSTSAIAISKLISTNNSTSRIKIRLPYKTNATKMLAFTIRMYGSYRHTDIACAGYLYSTPNQWYIPTAKIIVDHGSGAGANIDVIFGRDDDGFAYVSIPSRQYYGVAIIDVVGGYGSATYGEGWEILDNDTTPNIGTTITTNGNYALVSDIKTYTAGNGLTLSGTSFSLPVTVSGSGTYVQSVAQTASGITVTLGTPPNTNTTYTAGNGLTLSGTQFSLPVTVSGSGSYVQSVAQTASGLTVTLGTPPNTDTVTRFRSNANAYISGDITLTAGSNVSLTQSGNVITISSTDTNTTYTAGNGLTLSGTAFSLPVTVSGSGTYVQSVAQTASGITVTLGTPPNTNTTYTAGNGLTLSGTVFSLPVTVSGTGNVVDTVVSSANGISVTKNLTAMLTSHPANGITSNDIDFWNTLSSVTSSIQNYLPLSGGTMLGKINLPASNTNGAMLNLPHGVAPATASTVNGDIWTTSAAVFVRLNGTTRQLAHTSSWSVITEAEITAGTSTSARFISGVRLKYAFDNVVAARASRLESGATINGVLFDGTTPITISATPLAHTHTISDVNGLQSALDNKQPLNSNLTAISALSSGTGLLKRNTNNTWVLDTTSYLSSESDPFGVSTLTVSGTTNKVVSIKLRNNNIVSATIDAVTEAELNGTASDNAKLISSLVLKNYIDNRLSTTMNYKGQVTNYSNLPTTGNNIGDVYNVVNANTSPALKAGDNVAWNGTSWDVLAGFVDISNLINNTQTIRLVGDVTASGALTANLTTTIANNAVTSGKLANIGTAGTYNNVVVNAKGQVTSGSNVSYSLSSHTHNNLVASNTAGALDINEIVKPSRQLVFYNNISSTSSNMFPMSNNANAVLHIGTHNSDYWHQLGFSSNKKLYHRSQNNAWNEIVYATTLNDYLPISGGTMTGNITLNNTWNQPSLIKDITGSANPTYGYALLRGKNSNADKGLGISNQGDLIYGDWANLTNLSSQWYKIYHSGNLINLSQLSNDVGYVTTDTTYSAGNGLTLSGTSFSLPVTVSGSGTYVQNVTQTTNGITVTLGTPPNTNTTYTAGNGLTLSGTAFSLPVTVSGSGTYVQSVTQTASGLTVTLGTPPNTNTDTVTRIRSNANALLTGDITLTAGTNTTLSQSGNVITISSTDTNTTYTAGNGLTLSGTAFSLPVTVSGSGTYVQSVAQTASGITVTLGTPPNTNTTYTAGNGLTLSGTAFSLPVTVSGSGTYVQSVAQTASGLTVTLGTPPNTNTDTVTRLRSNANAYVTGDITLTAGSNVTLTQSGNVITVASTNTNTTYTAGNGLTLSGTAFSLPVTVSGSGTYVQSVTQTASGITVTLGTPPNTTYSAGTLALLTAGTDTSNRVWSASVLSEFLVSQVQANDTLEYNQSTGGIQTRDWTSEAYSNYSMALGNYTTVQGVGAIALGYAVSTFGMNSQNVGAYSNVNSPYSVNLGTYNAVNATKSGTLGLGLITNQEGLYAVGRYNTIDSQVFPYFSERTSLQKVFVVGTGLDDSSRKNAMEVFQDNSTHFLGKSKYGDSVSLAEISGYINVDPRVFVNKQFVVDYVANNASTSIDVGTLAHITGANSTNRIWSGSVLKSWADNRLLYLSGGTMTGSLAINSTIPSAVPAAGSAKSNYTMSLGTTAYGTQFGTLSNGQGFIQQGRNDGTATTYQLNLNPNGGNVAIGNLSGSGNRMVIANASGVLSSQTIPSYSAGNGLTLSGTAFSLPVTVSGSGTYVQSVTQTASGLTVTLGTPPNTNTDTVTRLRSNANALLTGDITLTAGSNVSLTQSGNTITVASTNTTYSAGNGLTLSGTAFSLPVTVSGSGTYVQSVTQTASGLTVTLGTPPNTNTTYAAGSYALLTAGTDTSYRVWTAESLSAWINAKGYSTITTMLRAETTGSYMSGGLTLIGGSNVTITPSNNAFTISSTDTTYTAGNGLTLSGGAFSLPITVSGSGTYVQSVAQTANGLTVTLGTPPNSTYSAGTLALLTAGTDTSNRVWSASILNSWLTGKGYLTSSDISSLTSTKLRANTNALISGDITLSAGTNTSLTQSGNVITINSTDNNTTYTAGNGLTLSGTAFSLPVTVSGSGTYVQSVAQTASGITVTLGTPPNTTYSAGTLALLTAGTDTSNRVWSASILNSWMDGMFNMSISPSYTTTSKYLGRSLMYLSNGSTSELGEISIWQSLLSSGSPNYDDPEFINGLNSIQHYNNSGNIERIADTQRSNNKSGYILKVTNNSAGAVGILHQVTAKANQQTIQILKAKIPVGYRLQQYNNSIGTNGKFQWLTSTAGTGKWEWYILAVNCGDTGTFSTYGHLGITVTSGTALSTTNPLIWYISYANTYDLTKGIGTALFARKLETARTINGVSFDGTANITVADSTKLPLTGGNITGSLGISTLSGSGNRMVIANASGVLSTQAIPTNTTYTAGNGLTLSGTAFSLPVTVSGSGTYVQSVAQTASGLTVTLGTPPNTNTDTVTRLRANEGTLVSGDITLTAGSNVTLTQSGNTITVASTNTTYSAGTLALLTAGTDTTNRVWTAKILTDFTDGKYFKTQLGSSPTDLNLEYRNGTGQWMNTTLNTPISSGYGTWMNIVSTGGDHNNTSNWINQFMFPATNESRIFYRSKINANAWGNTVELHSTRSIPQTSITSWNNAANAISGLTNTKIRSNGNALLTGDITLTAGSNVSLTQSGNVITINATNTNTDTVTRLRSNANAYVTGDITLTAGTNVTMSQSGNVITINATNTNTVTRLRANAGTLVSGDITLTAGSNVTLAQSGNTITINATNTNTTYTAGNGLTLSGTAFSLPITVSGSGTFVSGVTQTTNGLTVSMGTPPSGGSTSTTTYLRSVEASVTASNLVSGVFRITLPSAIHSSSVMVFLNGVKLPRSKTSISGTTINIANSGLLTPIMIGDYIEIEYLTN